MTTTLRLALLGLALCVGPATARAADPTDDARIVHVLNRLGYGPTPGAVERVRAIGLEVWIKQQLHPETIDDSACEARLSGLEVFRLSATDLVKQTAPVTAAARKQRNELVRSLQRRGISAAERAETLKQIRALDAKGDPSRALVELSRAKLIRAVHSERQLEQVMTDFWFNHFNVFSKKGNARMLLPEYEEHVIRPRAFGPFLQLLVATAKSPAMLLYLDNWTSKAPPGAPVRRRPGKFDTVGGPRGLNENYGRELLELHTVGVDGGYTQQDIIEVARCFTGWTVNGGAKNATRFRFRPEWHDAGAKKVMGADLPAGGGLADGMRILRALAEHPATARYLSEKLCRRFVADEPPPDLVARCAASYLDSNGDIRRVLETLFLSEEFLDPNRAGRKVKKPHELVASALRALGTETTAPRALLAEIARMGEPLYGCEPPTGFGDTAEDWGGTSSVLNRVNFALELAGGRARGVAIDVAALEAQLPTDGDRLGWLARRVLGRPLSKESRAAADRAVKKAAGTYSKIDGESTRLAELRFHLSMILGSPDFQMQ